MKRTLDINSLTYDYMTQSYKSKTNQQKNSALKLLLLIISVIGALFMLSLSAKAQGEDPIKIGFIPLTDCAPVVMAKELGLFKKYGVNVILSKEASWANIRDKVLTGELDGAHCLFGMPFSVFTGVGGKEGSEMKIAMVLNNNGQAITLSKELCGIVGYKEFNKVPEGVKYLQARKDVTFAMTFPGGTHDMWLRVWLAYCGISMKNIGIITIHLHKWLLICVWIIWKDIA